MIRIEFDHNAFVWKVYVWYPVGPGQIQVYENGSAEYRIIKKDQRESIDPADVKPWLVLNSLTEEPMREFLAELESKGVRLDADAKREGKIEALRDHLTDLRHLLKLPKAIK